MSEPQPVMLPVHEQSEAVVLLAGLTATAAGKRRPIVSDSVLDGVSDGAFLGVVRHTGKPGKAGGA